MDFCCAVAGSFSAHLGLVLSASGADLLLVFTEVQAGTLPGCSADLHSSPASFPLPETIPSGGPQHLCAGTEPHTDLWQKKPRGKPRKSFVPGYFPFFVRILLSSLPLLAIPIDAGVNVLFKQPPMAEKWRHMAGLYQGQMDSALTGQQGGQPRRHCPTMWSPGPAGRRRNPPLDATGELLARAALVAPWPSPAVPSSHQSSASLPLRIQMHQTISALMNE